MADYALSERDIDEFLISVLEDKSLALPDSEALLSVLKQELATRSQAKVFIVSDELTNT